MFGFKKKNTINEVEALKLQIAELTEYATSLEKEVERKDKKIAMMEKIMKIDQQRHKNR